MESIIAQLKKLVEDNPFSKHEIEVTIGLLAQTEECAKTIISQLPNVEEVPISEQIDTICNRLFNWGPDLSPIWGC